MFNETSYNRGLSGEAAKAKRRAKYGIPEGVKAGMDYVQKVWLPAQKTAQQQAQAGSQSVAAPGNTDTSGVFGFDLPKKIAGMPTWMMLAGGALVVLTMFKGSSRRKK